MKKRDVNLTLLEGAARSENSACSFAHPDDVVSDPQLSLARKRAILASWVSDVRAVENAPALRRLDSGAIVAVDDVLQALVRLDRAAPGPRLRRRSRAFVRQDDRVIWLSRPQRRDSDPDDDPPPAPAGLAVPFRPRFVAAAGVRVREAACVSG